MKTIIVPTDFSKNANHALMYAMELAKLENANILLLHAYSTVNVAPDISYNYAAAILGTPIENTDKQVSALLKKIEAKNVKGEALNVEGTPVDVILDMAEKKKPYLIVMGTKGASGLEEIIMGSNTATVIEKAKCPVIAVPEKAKFGSLNNITYATDYHTSDIDALKRLVEIATLSNSIITIVHVVDQTLFSDDDAEFMNSFKKKVMTKIHYPQIQYKLIYGDDVVKELETYIKKEKPDLFAMSMQHRNIYEKLFRSSVTKKMAYHTKVPLMAFHYKKDSLFFI